MSARRYMRLFVAVDVPGEIKEKVAAAVGEIGPDAAGVRWVKPENLHITLKFIGDYGEERLGDLIEEVRATARLCDGFTVSLAGCGAFPSRGRARVLWLGMARGGEEAAAAARKLDSRLERVGVKREERGFRSHLTLARLRNPADCSACLLRLEEKLKGLEEKSFEVEEMVLYRSILGPHGPTYIPLEGARLGGR